MGRLFSCRCEHHFEADELDAVLVKRFEDSEDFQSIAAYAVEVGHQDGVYLVMPGQVHQLIQARAVEVEAAGCLADYVGDVQA